MCCTYLVPPLLKGRSPGGDGPILPRPRDLVWHRFLILIPACISWPCGSGPLLVPSVPLSVPSSVFEVIRVYLLSVLLLWWLFANPCNSISRSRFQSNRPKLGMDTRNNHHTWSLFNELERLIVQGVDVVHLYCHVAPRNFPYLDQLLRISQSRSVYLRVRFTNENKIIIL